MTTPTPNTHEPPPGGEPRRSVLPDAKAGLLTTIKSLAAHVGSWSLQIQQAETRIAHLNDKLAKYRSLVSQAKAQIQKLEAQLIEPTPPPAATPPAPPEKPS